jgi:uncharacterized Zn finger protein (UPF0148 family)
MLHELNCPTCGAPGLEAHQPDGTIVCRFCGNKFATDDRIACPYCEAVNSPEADFCEQCGDKLKRTCPACGAENWAGAEYCATCGRNLDALALMAQRHVQGFKGTLQQQREIANLIKAEEEADSQKRMANLWEIEKRRQDELERQKGRQQAQQNVVLVIAFVIGVLFVLLMLGVFVALVFFR